LINSQKHVISQALLSIKIFKEDLMQNSQQIQDQRQEQVPTALQNLFTAVVSEAIQDEGVYSCLLSDFLTSQEEFLSMVCVKKYASKHYIINCFCHKLNC